MKSLRPQRKRLEELEEIARVKTREALVEYERLSDEAKNKLVLGIGFAGDERIFQLYVPGERPEEAVVVTRVPVNSITGEASDVEVFLPKMKDGAASTRRDPPRVSMSRPCVRMSGPRVSVP